MRLLRAAPLLVLALLAGCGGGDGMPMTVTAAPPSSTPATTAVPAPYAGTVATKNTTRVGGADAVADAAAVAMTVFPAGVRPDAVVLANAGDWHASVAAAVLMAAPVRAPLLLTYGGTLPPATRAALDALRPAGSDAAGGAQVIRVGTGADVAGRPATDLRGATPFALARAIDAFRAAAAGNPADAVLVVGADDPAYAMPAAAWAAKSGDPVLFTARDALPADTRAALRAHGQPRIYVLGPEASVSAAVERRLRRLGTVTRIAGEDPVRNAVAFARFRANGFGWGITDPGHGLVFASTARPSDAGAAAPLSGTGTYGPLLLVDRPGTLPAPVASFLLDIQPGFESDPVRGVYNHGWLVGDGGAIAAPVQSKIDGLLEIAPVAGSHAP